MSDIKQMGGNLLKGCGCLSIGFFVLLIIVGIFSDDDEKKELTELTVDDLRGGFSARTNIGN